MMIQAALLSCWPLAAALAAVCVCLAVTAHFIQPEQRRPIFALHRDERGSVQSLSFVLTVPFFMMLMMGAVQLTQVMIGNIVVNYAAYAAARSASVWIPAKVETPTWELANWLNLRQLSGPDASPDTVMASPKMVQIHRSAALACLSIAPSRDLLPTDDGDAMTGAIQSAYSAYSSSYQTNSRLHQRLANKWAYAVKNTSIDISTFHRRFGTAQSGYQNEPPLWDLEYLNPEGYYKPTELGWRDEVTVKVTHNFALLPGPGRLLARSTSSGASTNPVQQNGNIYYVPISASATIVPEGEKSLAPFVYVPFWP